MCRGSEGRIIKQNTKWKQTGAALGSDKGRMSMEV